MNTIQRSAIIAEARSWIGTPYRHQASCKRAGCDCIGLVRGVWRALVGAEPEPMPDYSPDWADGARGEPLLDALERRLTRVREASPGDVLAFRMAPHAAARHVAVHVSEDRIVHAYWGRAVLESRLVPYWRTRIVAAYSFPGADSWPR